MTRVPFLDLKAQYATIRDEVQAALAEVCDSARFAQGPPTQAFEKEFAAYGGVAHCVSLNSGTSALHLALRALDIGPGDEVITTPFTFIATAWAISYVGATPVFVDIDPVRRTLDPARLDAAITPRTKAIMPVHIFGTPADMGAINAVAAKHKLAVVEDAAQAHGARYKGKRAGQLGVMSCFSFYPTKNLGAYGEGGALLTDDEKLAARVRSLREHAQSARYVHEEVGYNYRMDSFQAAVLRVKLKQLDAWNAARAAHARRYTDRLKGTRYGLPTVPADSEPVWHCYVIECEHRDGVRAALADGGIDTAINYPVPLHLQPVYRSLGYHRGDLPVAERLCERCLSLPIYPELTPEQIDSVVQALRAVA
ncbi:MAG TPA: DegT/DnrJ/EryC1/StrS family aminotransferase [Verrucomicrobiae bacterium]|nr:DegT/DnrJ/EryC1/StrS family aminotransferase [Verrucomicrobiae bacterium]